MPNSTRLQLVSVVDDDPSVRRALRRLIQSAGFIAQAFASGEEFLGSATLIRTACLVLDIQLNGGMSGFELQARLVADRVAIPIIFITGNDDATTREHVERSGAAAYLCKPFDDDLLLGAIRGAVGTNGLRLDQGPIGKPDGAG